MKIERDIIPETYFKVLKQALVFGNAKKQTSFYLYKNERTEKKKACVTVQKFGVISLFQMPLSLKKYTFRAASAQQ